MECDCARWLGGGDALEAVPPWRSRYPGGRRVASEAGRVEVSGDLRRGTLEVVLPQRSRHPGGQDRPEFEGSSYPRGLATPEVIKRPLG